MGRIRVCNVIEEGRFGGPQRRIIQVAKALKPYGVDTHVVYPSVDSQRMRMELELAGVPGTALDITRLSKEKRSLGRYAVRFWFEVCQLSRFFRRYEFNLIHVNGSYQFKSALAARLSGIPFVWHLNDTSMNGAVKCVCSILARCWASGLILAGNRVRQYYVKDTALEQKTLCEIEAPVDTRLFDPDRAPSDVRVSGVSGIKVATVSAINPAKGLEYFVKMAADLHNRYPRLAFYVAGAELSSQAEYYHHLRKLVASSSLTSRNFAFIGTVNNVASFLRSVDICVFTSISEASPTTVWEAMSMGKPVVSTDVGSVNKYIDDGVSGFIVPIKDAQALAEKVEILLENPKLGKEMGRKARLIAQQNLDIRVAAEKHALFYERVISSIEKCDGATERSGNGRTYFHV